MADFRACPVDAASRHAWFGSAGSASGSRELVGGERLLAEQRLRNHGYIVITDRRLIWTEGPRFLSLPFERITGAQEIFEESHRYRLRLLHEPIEREQDAVLPWDIPRHVRRFRHRRRSRATDIPFSRVGTGVAVAIRQALAEADVTFLPRLVRAHRRDAGRTLYPPGPIRTWWYRRRLRGSE